MGLLNWLFGGNKKAQTPKKKTASKRKNLSPDELFELKRKTFQDEINKMKQSKVASRVKIIVDKNDLDACSKIKKGKKIYPLNEVPLIPLNKTTCQHCTCYYQAIIKD